MRASLIEYSAAISILSTLLTWLMSGLAHQFCTFWRYQNPGTQLPELTVTAPLLAKLVTAIPVALLIMTVAMAFPKNYREKWLVHGVAITCRAVVLTGIFIVLVVNMPALTSFHPAKNPPGLD